ncbi:MAG TPA: SH3 domain-containing protein [Verrucomicrobiae bacterium]|nr:SH3 domain-containing protein [Verrucomicrobiae bacterium]
MLLRTYAAEETATVTESKINVRGQPSLVGEVITQLQKGDRVTVLEHIKTEKPKGDEPVNWAKIKLPANTPVWVFAPMTKDGAVAASRLNLRAGPGENYSVIGRMQKGDKIKEIRKDGEWIEVEPPEGAYAFVDASLIKGAGTPAVAAAAPTVAAAPAVPVVTRPQPQPIAPPPTAATPKPSSELATATIPTTPVPQPQATPAVTTFVRTPPPQETPITRPSTTIPPPETAATAFPSVLPKVAAAPGPKPEQPLPKRVVRREGIIRATKSIQAPTWYELVHPETKTTIDFLNAEKLGIKLKEYKGQRVIVSGEEGVDSRWPNTPILELETLDVVP